MDEPGTSSGSARQRLGALDHGERRLVQHLVLRGAVDRITQDLALPVHAKADQGRALDVAALRRARVLVELLQMRLREGRAKWPWLRDPRDVGGGGRRRRGRWLNRRGGLGGLLLSRSAGWASAPPPARARGRVSVWAWASRPFPSWASLSASPASALRPFSLPAPAWAARLPASEYPAGSAAAPESAAAAASGRSRAQAAAVSVPAARSPAARAARPAPASAPA